MSERGKPTGYKLFNCAIHTMEPEEMAKVVDGAEVKTVTHERSGLDFAVINNTVFVVSEFEIEKPKEVGSE